jgi:hypothetical protein
MSWLMLDQLENIIIVSYYIIFLQIICFSVNEFEVNMILRLANCVRFSFHIVLCRWQFKLCFHVLSPSTCAWTGSNFCIFHVVTLLYLFLKSLVSHATTQLKLPVVSNWVQYAIMNLLSRYYLECTQAYCTY